MVMLHVVKPGLLTTIQDNGRWGYQSRGVPVAGPMDQCSHRIANALVGNDTGAATLEVTLVGPELEFEDERVIAVAGAEFELMLDGRSVPSVGSLVAPAGSRLHFGRRVRGTRAYLAVAGGIAVPSVFGSRSTHLMSAMGGIDGRALMAGDRLPLGQKRGRTLFSAAAAKKGYGPFSGASQARPAIGLPARPARVRVLPGPNHEYFTAEALDVLQSAPYVIGHNSDRMGYRLEGATLTHARGGDIISEATLLGALQVPASGQPILLMADRATTGGYPKIATVISADISVAGQLGPGDALWFVVCSRREALGALIAQERALMAFEAQIAS